MLKQRIITALVLLALLVPAVLATDTRAFAVVSLVFVAAGAWEWGRMNQCAQASSVGLGVVLAVACLVSLMNAPTQSTLWVVWMVAGGLWVVAGAWLLRVGAGVWPRVPQALRLVFGVFALWVAWLAVWQARLRGINFLFSVLVLVWVADICAYFSGRAFGGRLFQQKLAPSISPGKTWEGAFGGMIGVLLGAFVWRAFDHELRSESASLYTLIASHGVLFMVVACMFLGTMSIVGDLVESLFKRSAGVKDSSGLLPGHGGVLDRVDALLPVLPLAMLLSSL